MHILKKLFNFTAILVLAFSVVMVIPKSIYALPAGNPTPVFRFYKFRDGAHFFTNSEAEKATVEAHPDIYRYEGIAYYSYPTQVTSSIPVYRFYNFINGVHFYTTNESERQQVATTATNTFRYEGIAYYALPSAVANTTPVHRFYNFRQGVHFYTSNQNEATNLNNTAYSTFRYEGISYYLPNQLTFSGSGNQATQSFILPTTLAVFSSTYTGSSNFIVWLKDANTNDYVDLIANEIGNANISVPSGVGENRYVMQVQSSGTWSITIDQPKISSGLTSSFSGQGKKATQLFTALRGAKTVTYTHDVSSYFAIVLWDENGNYIDLLANSADSTTSGSSFTYTEGGNYMMGIEADGNWTINLN